VLSEKYNYERLGKRWMLKFYAARYLRLYPAYLLSTVLLVLMYWSAASLFGSKGGPWVSWEALLSLPHSVSNVLLLIWAGVSNVTIFLQDLGGVLAVRDQHAILTVHRSATQIYAWGLTVNGVTWSLGVELMFYFLAPYFIRRSNLQLLLLVLVGFILKAWAVFALSGDLPYRMFPFVLANFLLGMLAYRMRAVLIGLIGTYTRPMAYCLMLVLTVALPKRLESWQYSLLVVPITALIVPALFYSSKNSRLDNRLGELSYPFYLFHIAIVSVLHLVLTKKAGISNAYVISLSDLTATIVFCQLVLALENRFLEPYRQKLGRPERVPVPVVSSTLTQAV